MSTHDNKTRNGALNAAIDEMGLSLDSLVGSYFHGYDDGQDPEYDLPTTQGRIVAEPQAGVYLVEMFDSLGTATHQEIAGLDRMNVQRWAFYDSQDAMQNRYLTLMATDRAGS